MPGAVGGIAVFPAVLASPGFAPGLVGLPGLVAVFAEPVIAEFAAPTGAAPLPLPLIPVAPAPLPPASLEGANFGVIDFSPSGSGLGGGAVPEVEEAVIDQAALLLKAKSRLALQTRPTTATRVAARCCL